MQDIRRSPEYQRWRQDVKERDENTCRVCGVQRNLHVHHIKPLEKYPEFATILDNGITLCGNCHVFLSGREENTNLKTVIEAITGQQDTRIVEQLKRLNDKFGEYLDALLKSSDLNTRGNTVYKLFVHLQIYPDSLNQFGQLIEYILESGKGFEDGFARRIAIEFLESHSSKTASQILSKYESSCYQDGKDAYSQGEYATALKKLKPLAERCHVGSQHLLSLMYYNGTGVAQDYNQAMKWALKAAEQGHNKSQCNVGQMYRIGKSVAKNDVEAVKWFRKAAEQGLDRAQYLLGRMYERSEGIAKDDVEAVKWYRKAAEQGYNRAQFLLGVMYKNGEGVDQDDAEAVKWYRKAAEQGYDRAQYLLGVIYRNGEGVSPDDVEAAKWFRKAAEQADDRAQYFLGVMYGRGEGVDQDDVEAVKWFRKAAEQGHDTAQWFLGQMYRVGGMGVDQDDAEAVKWFRKAAEQGHELAQNQLERMYENGKDGLEIDDVDLQGISITRKDFFQRLSMTGIELCLFTLETSNARIEIKGNRFTLSDVGNPSGSGLSAPLKELFDENVKHDSQLHLSKGHDQLEGKVFLTEEDIPILKAFRAAIKVRARVKEKLDKAERNLSKVYGALTADVEAFQIDVIRLWRDEEIPLQSGGYDEEVVGSLTDLRHQIHGSIDQLLEALHQRRRTITTDVVALTKKDNT